jgi:hypothetical protein
MKKWLRRIRGAVGMGLAWAGVWFGVGAVFALLSGVPLNGALLENALQVAVLAFVNGMAFSVVLRVAEGHRRFDELSLWRFAGLGAVGGFVVSLLTGGWGFLGTFIVLGAGSAAGSLALARRANDRDLLEHGADVADIGLTEAEKRELLAG